jgi:Mn-containing catalase
VGATITMLLDGVNGEIKDAAEGNLVAQMGNGSVKKDNVIGAAMDNPRFLLESAGGPMVTDSVGTPWTGSFVNANGDLTVDLRSNIAAETRAKIVYERLLEFTDDPYVQDSLRFLMTREIAHFQQFSAALMTIEPNFPPGIMQGDLRFTHTYFNMSNGEDSRGPWNKGKGPWEKGEQWEYVGDPVAQVSETAGQSEKEIAGHSRDPEATQVLERELGAQRSGEVKVAATEAGLAWSNYETT